jgi:hypothetical protein
MRREYWPDADAPVALARIEPDLEDVVIALSLSSKRRALTSSGATT